MMWVILAAPWLARSSRCAASVLSKHPKKCLHHDSCNPTIVRCYWNPVLGALAVYRAVDLTVGTNPPLHQGTGNVLPFSTPHRPVTGLLLQSPGSLVHAFCSAATQFLAHASVLDAATPPPPSSPTSSATVSVPDTVFFTEDSKDGRMHRVAGNCDSVAAAADTTGLCSDGFSIAGPGPSSAVLQLMSQIRRSCSAVDLRFVLLSQAEVVDYLALVAAMTRLTQLAATSRRAADRAMQRELISELAATLAGSEHLRRCGARQVGTCLHSLAELGVAPSERLWEALLDALCEDRSVLLRTGNGVDVSVIALALARLNCPHRRAWRAVARGVEAHAASMSPQHVANTLSALARAEAHEHRTAFATLLERAVSDIEALSGRNLANALWAAVRHLEALGALGERIPEATRGKGIKIAEKSVAGVTDASVAQVAGFAATLARRLPERLRLCPPTELAGVAWSFAALGWTEPQAWDRLGAQLRLSAGALKPAELCMTAEALQAASSRAAAAAAAAANVDISPHCVTGQCLPSEDEAAEVKVAAATTTQVDPTETVKVTAVTAATSAVLPVAEVPRVDPGDHIATLFSAASLRIRELRPQHLARLLNVLRQHAAPPHHSAPQQDSVPVAGPAPALAPAQADWRNADLIPVVQDLIAKNFMRETRIQLLRAPLSAFPHLSVVTSLVTGLSDSTTSVTSIGESTPGEISSRASVQHTSAGTAAATESRGRPDVAEAPGEPTAGAVLDHLAAAAVTLAMTASASDLRSVMTAFAAAGHFNAELCTVAAARVEALARLVDTSSLMASLTPLATASQRQRQGQRQRRPQDSADLVAAVGEVSDLVDSLRALAQLGFHNEAALDAMQPAVAAAVQGLPVQGLTAALGAYAASGAPPLALASSLAAAILRHMHGQDSLALPSPQVHSRHQHEQQRQQGQLERSLKKAGEQYDDAKGMQGIGEADCKALREACRKWRGSMLYPGGIMGTTTKGSSKGRVDADVTEGDLKDTRIWDGDATALLPGFDRCLELVVSLRT